MSLLAQTGAIGTTLFAAFAAAAGLAAYRKRREGAAQASLVAGGVTAFAYWMLHGSVDWLWEFPALGLGAFLLLGLAIGPSTAAPVGRWLRVRDDHRLCRDHCELRRAVDRRTTGGAGG